MKYIAAGSLGYQEKISYLTANGFEPKLDIADSPVGEWRDLILSEEIDLLVCFAYPHILKQDEINLFKIGCINFHPGLPKFRGRHPLNWMLIEGVTEIPVAIHFMDAGIDTGEIIVQSSILVEREDNYKTVTTKLDQISPNLMLQALIRLERGDFSSQKQNSEISSYYPKRTPSDSHILWSKSSKECHSFIRALHEPMPNAFSYVNGSRHLKIEFSDSIIGVEPGVILHALGAESPDKPSRYVISTGDGVCLVESAAILGVGDKLS